MNLCDAEFVIFDVETTGLSPLKGDRIIEIGAIKIRNKKVVDTFESFMNPQRSIPAEATAVNNITDEMVADAPVADQVLPNMIDFIGGACVVGQNVKFDLDFLCYQLSLMGRKLNNSTPAIDTIKIAKKFLPQLRSYRLSALALALGIMVEETHRALADVYITRDVLLRLLERCPDHNIISYGDMFKEFGVQKPKFKIESVEQGTLF